MESSKAHSRKNVKPLHFLLFTIPFALALLSWWSFPLLAEWLSKAVFGYEPMIQPTSWLWQAAVTLYFSWFTFLAIGIGGLLIVGAWLSRRTIKQKQLDFYPMVSFVVPAFNEEGCLPRCINSLFESGAHYSGPVEVIVVDDGSDDSSYEVGSASVQSNMMKHPEIRGRVVRHMTNLGKTEALRTGANRALGQIVAVVDADSWWDIKTLEHLVEYMRAHQKVAVTGYVHPSDSEANPYVVLQQLEYSQGLSIFRSAQALGNSVLVVPGAIGLFDADVLRELLNQEGTQSVTEDFEITLNLQKRGHRIGYLNTGRCRTQVPSSLSSFWSQRSRWFVGWLHNTLDIHRDMLSNKHWLGLLLWYCLIVEYAGAFIELTAVGSFPLLFWFAPDRVLFVLNMLWFGAYMTLIGISLQAIALRFAYGEYNHKYLLYYTPFYAILRLVNVLARATSAVKYAYGYRGRWEKKKLAVSASSSV